MQPALAQEEIVFIVHNSNPANELTRQEIKNIYLGKKRTWNNDEPIVFVIQKNNKLHEKFTHQVLVKSPLQFSLYWKKKLFTGKGLPPKSVENNQEMIDFVAAHPNSIGYVGQFSSPGVVKKIVLR